MSHAREFWRQPLERRSAFQLGRAAAAAHARRVDRLLDVHAPVERVHDGQRDVVDDGVATGRDRLAPQVGISSPRLAGKIAENKTGGPSFCALAHRMSYVTEIVCRTWDL